MPHKGEEPAHVANFLPIGNTLKVVERAIKDVPNKEALKDESIHVMNACFGPKLAKKVHEQHSGPGTSRPKGNAEVKSDNVDDDDLKKDILENIVGHPPP
jgi:hypothetical protein